MKRSRVFRNRDCRVEEILKQSVLLNGSRRNAPGVDWAAIVAPSANMSLMTGDESVRIIRWTPKSTASLVWITKSPFCGE